MSLTKLAENQCFGGRQLRYSHEASSLDCEMHFSVYLPPQAENGKVPVVYWLSGLTCTDQNFVQKAGAQQYAAKYGLAIVSPDTSPRGEDVPDDPEEEYDFGLGAGFYVNATEPPWDEHYQMYGYVSEELPTLVASELPVDEARTGIFGHSMGGHGALVIGLRNPSRFKSISAFAPICSPMNCYWGEKALGGYLGDDREDWREYDACELILRSEKISQQPLLIDIGAADNFLDDQLKPELLREACKKAGCQLDLRIQPGYDHSYYFMSTFMEDHIHHHAWHLG
jgi:S-formylglutathione hydrolase